MPVAPPRAFASAPLVLLQLPRRRRLGRIFADRYPHPLGVGKTPSRFSDPRDLPEAERFAVLYLGSTLAACFVEAFLRDQRNGVVGDYPVSMRELNQRRFAEITVRQPLALVDLTGNGAVRMGVPSDVCGATDQTLARQWSLAFHEHPQQPDGIAYLSRLNNDLNVAVYDRAIAKLDAEGTALLPDAPGFPRLLDAFGLALVD